MNLLARRAAALAAVTLGLALAAPPATADPGAVAFTGTAQMGCFDCTGTYGTAALTVAGATVGRGAVLGAVHATYSVAPGPVSCLVSGAAEGTFVGAVNGTFRWTRIGAVAVITTSGDINGQGTAAFVVTSPIGVPCGAPVDATVAGAVAGV